MRRIVALLASLTLLFGGSSAAAAGPDEHIHVRVTNHPVDGKPIPRAPYTFNLVIQTHDMPGTVTSVRVSSSSSVRKTQSISVTNSTSPQTIPFTVDFSTWSVGRHELRWTANRPSGNGLPRLYNSTGWQVCIESCSPNIGGRATPFIEARGWQSDYANVRILTPFRDLRAGQPFRVQAANTSTKGWCAMNPDIHAGFLGTRIGSFGRTTTTLTIPSTFGPGDKLVCQANQGTRTGVLALILPSAADPEVGDMESQVWWNAAGLNVQ